MKSLFLILLLSLCPLLCQGANTITSLNCYWFMDPEDTPGERGDPPATAEEKNKKAENLIALLLKATRSDTPWIIALQEIGGENELESLAMSLSLATGQTWEPYFKNGRDTFTGQNVGILLNMEEGWKVRGQAARHGDLEKVVSKHIVLTLEKEGKTLHLCNVHLRVPKDPEAQKAHQEQNVALLRWGMRHMSQNPNASVIILGDFNEPKLPGEEGAHIDALLSQGYFQDAIRAVPGSKTTHQKIKKALDRIIISSPIANGTGDIIAEDIWITPHQLVPKTGTDHFPITLKVKEKS